MDITDMDIGQLIKLNEYQTELERQKHNELKMENMIPTYKFALREDLKNDKKFLPTKGESEATGWDVSYAALPNKKNRYENLIIKQGQWVKLDLGIRCFAPKGWWLELRPRSSTSLKKNIHALYGVIDECYSDSICFVGQYLPDGFLMSTTCEVEVEQAHGYYDEVWLNTTTNLRHNLEDLVLSHGDRIGQLVPVRRQEMNIEEISNKDFDNLVKERNSDRKGGFGSTGSK